MARADAKLPIASPLQSDAIDLQGQIDQAISHVKQAALEAGMSRELCSKLINRLKPRFTSSQRKLREASDEQLTKSLGDKIVTILDSIDPFDIATATLKEKTVALGVLIDKKQLLEGKPTQIMSTDERRRIDELVPALMQEALRRGITIEGQYSEVKSDSEAGS